MKVAKLPTILVIVQVLFIVFFAIFADYAPSANAKYPENSKDADKGGADPSKNKLHSLYDMFQHVHVMIFIGFGFLMTFLRRYGFSSVGFNMLIAAFVIQWHMITHGLLHMATEHSSSFKIDIESLLTADFAAAAVLISFGAVLGKTSPLQLIVMAFIEIIVFVCNEYIGLYFFKASDVGGSMFVHIFGAYFGIAAARILYNSKVEDSKKEGSNYHSDLFAMIGTIFLWLYWPSFNSALAPGDDQHRAVINTYLALASCVIVAFAISSNSKEAKFDMVHVQNATLAGGVAVGTSANFMIGPWGALLIGSVAGAISVVGYKYITPYLARRWKAHDTCGVNNLHGMPGILAGLFGAIFASFASVDRYGNGLYEIFPARAPMENSTKLLEIQANFTISAGDDRSAVQQGGYQFLAMAVTLIVALVAGAITGFIMKMSPLDPVKERHLFDDGHYWETPSDFDEAVQFCNGTDNCETVNLKSFDDEKNAEDPDN
ncbi:DgyrCDS2739 [Dimorphilus gyrociliatus]|uniref:DgyrCDS2739 n=1 Tax=Dimorphilus gyrociliatus TaxID=2664684 RepID=A0A7I8VBS3_9ANNE|nr:DgyrCDS2739 [Dimorphilus gyrociliatus]